MGMAIWALITLPPDLAMTVGPDDCAAKVSIPGMIPLAMQQWAEEADVRARQLVCSAAVDSGCLDYAACSSGQQKCCISTSCVIHVSRCFDMQRRLSNVQVLFSAAMFLFIPGFITRSLIASWLRHIRLILKRPPDV